MKRFILVLLALLIVPAFAVEAQSKKKGKKEESPIIAGKQKIRKQSENTKEWEEVSKFTVFNPKLKEKKYFCDFDYSTFPSIVTQKQPQWGSFTPVFNYLSYNRSATMTIVAMYAVNPTIEDDAQRETLAQRAANEAVEALNAFNQWLVKNEYKNKIVFRVAQIDYRYWLGEAYFAQPAPTDEVLHVGLLMKANNKKGEMFTDPSAGARTFSDIKFFPNDATVVTSYNAEIDSLAEYLNADAKLEVLLTGYSDNVGTQMYNKQLSRQRCVEIKKMLVLRGVREYRIEVVARGELDPKGDNNTYEGRIANNRVAIKIQ